MTGLDETERLRHALMKEAIQEVAHEVNLEKAWKDLFRALSGRYGKNASEIQF